MLFSSIKKKYEKIIYNLPKTPSLKLELTTTTGLSIMRIGPNQSPAPNMKAPGWMKKITSKFGLRNFVGSW